MLDLNDSAFELPILRRLALEDLNTDCNKFLC